MILTLLIIPTLLADTEGNWASAAGGFLGGSGFAGLVAWYMLTKWGPRNEEQHGQQLVQQRADLLTLAATERALAERIVEIFAKSQGITIADNHRAINEVKDVVEETRKAASEILEKMREDTTLKDEAARYREEVERYKREHNYGSDLKKRNQRGNNNQQPPES